MGFRVGGSGFGEEEIPHAEARSVGAFGAVPLLFLSQRRRGAEDAKGRFFLRVLRAFEPP